MPLKSRVSHPLAAALVLVAALGLGGPAWSEDPAPPAAADAGKKPKPKAAASAGPQVQIPSGNQILLLVRTTILALSDATQTGNFTVLRDLGAPGFRDANPASKLSQTFANIANQGVDLSAVAIIAPKLTATPVLDPKTSLLRIKGFFPGEPVQINFELLFQPVAGRWRVFGLAVNPGPSAAAAAGATKLPETPTTDAQSAPAQ